jgi:[acyl-carrier-protein] S-malonyltransferase
MAKIAFLFPGQGSQYVGMGKDLYQGFATAKAIFEEANNVLGFDLARVCFEGPEEELKKTKNTQPAILVHSVAVLRLLINEGIHPDMAAGHSLGEYSAQVSAGSLKFQDAVRLVRLRGELMYQAGLDRPGTMAAIVGLSGGKVEELCRQASQNGIVCAANYNSPVQVVVSGESPAVEMAMALARSAGAKMAVKLEVSGAFHSPLMDGAYLGLKETLEKTEIHEAHFPVVANASAEPVLKACDVRRMLQEQLLSPVLWEPSLRRMIAMGATQFVELGPGKVLTGLLKKLEGDLSCVNVDGAASLAETVDKLR